MLWWRRKPEPTEFERLCNLIRDNREDDLVAAINAGFSVNFQDPKKLTLLMVAAEHQNIDLVKRLVELGADVTLKEDLGYDAEAIAYWHGEWRMGAYTEKSKAIAAFLKAQAESQPNHSPEPTG